MRPLHEMTADYRMLQDQLDSAETPEEMRQTLMDTMESIGGEIEDKAENMAAMVSDNKAMIMACKTEIQRLTDKVKRPDNQNDSIMSYMMMEMRFVGIRKIKAAHGRSALPRTAEKLRSCGK